LSAEPADNVTQLLIELSNGDSDVVDLLLPVIYDELRKLAANYLRRERPDHTLQPTALVHEAYLRLVDQTRVNWQNRAHFFGVAAQIMRRLLVDHARKHNAEKRGQDFQKLSLDENIDRAVERSAELIALDDALKALAAFDEQKARMVELRYFGGLSIEETADVLGVTPTTVKRHWRFAKAWLLAYLKVDTNEEDCLGNEPVYAGQEMVGVTTGGAYGFAVRKSLAFAYLEPRFAKSGVQLQVILRGETREAQVIPQPLWDPRNERLRS